MSTGPTRTPVSSGSVLGEAMSVLPVPAQVHQGVIDAIASTVQRGTVLSTTERNAVAYLARTPGYWESVALSAADVAWVRQLVDDPGGLGPDTVQRLFGADVNVTRLVEMLNVAAQVRAVDTYCFAVGMGSVPLPLPAGEAEHDPSSPPVSLYDTWYVSADNGGDVSTTVGPLDRLSVEYVAGLVSYLNESVIDLATHAGLLRLADTGATIAAEGLRLERFRLGTVPVADAGLIAAFVRAGHERDAHGMVGARVELTAHRGPAFAAAVASVHSAFELMNRLTLGVVAGLGPQLDRDHAQRLWRQITGSTHAPVAAGISELGFGPQDLALVEPKREAGGERTGPR